jgi:hypothetical protein
MGQAFDRDGNVMGEAIGASFREVLDKLQTAHPDAHAIRVEHRGDTASAEMPRYRSHKEVWALKIQDVIDPAEPGNESDGSRTLRFEDHVYAPISVDREYVRKHNPQAGGYYVVYADGYKSWSPAEAFESGYTRVSEREDADTRTGEE